MPHDQCCPVCGGMLPDMPVTVFPERGIVVAGGRFATITGREAAVLERLCQAYPSVVSKTQLMDSIYATAAGEEPMEKIIDVFICKLRKKVEPLGVRIETTWGSGYALGAMPSRPVINRESAA